MNTPTVCIIVLTWNGLADTLDCLESLSALTYSAVSVLVVDNGSSDGSVETISQRFPHVDVLALPTNLGYVGGNNAGLRSALADGFGYALLLNNDTVVAPDLIENLLKPQAEVVGPAIFYADQPDVHWSAGGRIDFERGTTAMSGTGEGGYVDFVTGCAMLVDLSILEDVGYLDERFFAYYEEAEWCVRAQRAGYRVWWEPTAHVWHKISDDARQVSPTTLYYMTRNRLLFMRAIGVGWRPWVRTALEYGRTLVSWSVRPKWRGRRHLRGVMARAIKDYWQGEFGRVVFL